MTDDAQSTKTTRENGPSEIAPNFQYEWDKNFWEEAGVLPQDMNVWHALNPRFSDLAKYYYRYGVVWMGAFIWGLVGSWSSFGTI